MKSYILCNFQVSGDSLITCFSNELLKNIAYNAKLHNKTIKRASFNYVAIPFEPYYEYDKEEVINFLNMHLSSINSSLYSDEYLEEAASIYKFFKENNKLDANFTLELLQKINSSNMDIFYSDGSSTSKKTDCSYGLVQILEESYDPDAVYEDFTKTTHKIITYSGLIPNGTNNIGELSGLNEAIEKRGGNKFQLIVSDSMYSLNCFREWIWNWKKNGYLAANKKQILNCDLIKSIQDKIENSDKIYLFKWTKGHADSKLNDLCDQLAKGELGI